MSRPALWETAFFVVAVHRHPNGRQRKTRAIVVLQGFEGDTVSVTVDGGAPGIAPTLVLDATEARAVLVIQDLLFADPMSAHPLRKQKRM